MRWAYGVTIRQCTEALRAKIEAEDRYEDITLSGDIIEPLKLIRNIYYSYHIHKHLPQAMHEELRKFYTTSQEKSPT